MSRLLVSVLALASLSVPAVAVEYCVSCSGPEASYRCAVADAPDGSGSDPRAQLRCITQLAETGGHETCSVMRNPVTPCEGPLTVIAAPIGEPPAAPPVQAIEGEPPLAGNADEAEAAEEHAGPPRTVEELAGKTVKQAGKAISGTAEKTGEAISGTAKKAGEQIGNAGSAVGNAAKKTWNCLTSLFNDC